MTVILSALSRHFILYRKTGLQERLKTMDFRHNLSFVDIRAKTNVRSKVT